MNGSSVSHIVPTAQETERWEHGGASVTAIRKRRSRRKADGDEISDFFLANATKPVTFLLYVVLVRVFHFLI